ncbi:MAG: response regulator [Ignavibacteriales bacterium]|nr:response regulator [Ignavibacteriales bacterium]
MSSLRRSETVWPDESIMIAIKIIGRYISLFLFIKNRIGMKALIVDDSLESRMLLGKILSKEFGAEIVEAANGEEAIKKISSENPDVVFLDYEMPTMNGKDTLIAIRSNRATRNLPVVIVTSHSEMVLVKELLKYKVSLYLVKPISAEYLVKHISIIFPKPSSNR